MTELQIQVKELLNKFPLSYYKSVDVDEGWYQIVVDCDKELSNLDPDYSIFQIKQKFGGLRYYFEPSDVYDGNLFAQMNLIVSKYESIAAVTCEATGKSGVLMKSRGAWYKTLNPEYAKTTLFFKEYIVI